MEMNGRGRGIKAVVIALVLGSGIGEVVGQGTESPVVAGRGSWVVEAEGWGRTERGGAAEETWGRVLLNYGVTENWDVQVEWNGVTRCGGELVMGGWVVRAKRMWAMQQGDWLVAVLPHVGGAWDGGGETYGGVIVPVSLTRGAWPGGAMGARWSIYGEMAGETRRWGREERVVLSGGGVTWAPAGGRGCCDLAWVGRWSQAAPDNQVMLRTVLEI